MDRYKNETVTLSISAGCRTEVAAFGAIVFFELQVIAIIEDNVKTLTVNLFLGCSNKERGTQTVHDVVPVIRDVMRQK